MTQENEKEEYQKLEDNLPMVQYIMLHRIYDILSLIADNLSGSEKTQQMVEYHNRGYLLGPAPSYSPEESE